MKKFKDYFRRVFEENGQEESYAKEKKLLKKEINFVKPKLSTEKDELERTAKAFKINFEELVISFNKADLIEFNDFDNLENTDSNDSNIYFGNTDRIIREVRALNERGREGTGLLNYERVIEQIEHGEIEAPIVWFRKGENPYLIGGNTRMMILRMLRIKPKVLAIKNTGEQ